VNRPLAWERAENWSEAVWLAHLRALATTLGWLVYHTHNSQRSASGFPDLTLVRERVVFVELKRQDKAAKLSPAQEVWRDRLLAAGAEWYCWRPMDADDAISILGRRQQRASTAGRTDAEVASSRRRELYRAAQAGSVTAIEDLNKA
jgi:hypothetical protein